jgi:tetratricopeptide (TPR) repeat protein
VNLPKGMNNKRGLAVGGIFALAGLIFVFVIFKTNKGQVLMLPGCFILLIFMSMNDIFEGGHANFIFLTNPLFYGVVGYLIGLFSKSRRQVFFIAGLLTSILLLYFHLICPCIKYIKDTRSINRGVQQAIKKLEADPNDIFWLHCLGVHHLTRTSKYREAEKYFRKVVDLESAKGGFSAYGQRSLIYLAIIYQSWGESERAEEHYQKFIGTGPDLENDLVLLNYNNNYLKRKDNQKTQPKSDN